MKKELNYSDLEALYTGRDVIVGLKTGTNLAGEVKFMDEKVLVLVNEPKSALDIATQSTHTVVNLDRIDFVQFKTDRK